MRFSDLKKSLFLKGASVAGVGDVTDALPEELCHLKRGISIAVRKDLNSSSVNELISLQRFIEDYLRDKGFRFFSIPPDSDRRNGTFASRLYDLFSHKTAATCAGLGWIGKNGLIINHKYGPKLTWATVLTDAPFETSPPITKSLCGDCDLCVRHCPSEALTGVSWNRSNPFNEIVIYDKCRALKTERHYFENKPNCGLCINICPYARKVYKNLSLKRVESQVVYCS
ncbi:MAG: epoxyqueuosine reductase [Nitrospirae bacterium]|nr:MAG: epoxyqueuosine reductase [Nitrospirota bacterium]